jgi:hypothetical protein
LVNLNFTQALVPVLLTQLAVAVVGLDGDNLAKEYGAKIQKDKNRNSMSAFGRGQTEEFDELNPNGRYSEFWPMRWPNKPNQPKSNHKTANHKSKPHFPIPAHSYFAPIIYNHASAFKPYVPLYVPKKTPSYDRPTSVSPAAYYTESLIYGYTTPSYPSPTFSPSPYFPPENMDSTIDPSSRPQYPSIFYNDLKKEPESSQNNVGAEIVNGDNDFPKFDDFLKQSLSFQHFRP